MITVFSTSYLCSLNNFVIFKLTKHNRGVVGKISHATENDGIARRPIDVGIVAVINLEQ